MDDIVFECMDNPDYLNTKTGLDCRSINFGAELDAYYSENDAEIPAKDVIDWKLRSIYLQDENVRNDLAGMVYLAQFLSHYCPFKSFIVRVIDGDTLVLDNLKIRLKGIDAPETKQTCTRKEDGQVWPCGKMATEKLVALIAKQELQCTDEGKDRYKRQLAYCYSDGINLNAEMVRQGYAIAYAYYDVSFVTEESYARKHGNGIWASDFVNPSDWRRAKY